VFSLPTVTFTAPADLCIDGIQSGLEAELLLVVSILELVADMETDNCSFDPAWCWNTYLYFRLANFKLVNSTNDVLEVCFTKQSRLQRLLLIY
jgi:hypothetical protein